MTDKRLPTLREHDDDAERSALGTVLTGQPFSLVYFAGESIFYDLRHQMIGRAVCGAAERDGFVNLVTVTHWLREENNLDAAGNLEYIHGLTVDVPFVVTADIFLEIVAGLAQRRAKARLNLRIAEALKNDDYAEASRIASEATSGLKEKTDRRYTLYTAADAYKPQPPIPWVVKDRIAQSTVNAFVGDAGVGKTRAITDLVCRVATNRSWVGHEVTGGPVLIIQEESSRDQFSRRLHESLTAHGLGPDTPIFFTALEGFQLAQPPEQDALEEAINETRAVIAVIDSQAAVTPGLDENSVQDMLPFLMALRRIADRTHCAIVIIHHLGKNGTSRGSTAIRGSVDTLVTIKAKDGLLLFESDKTRDTEPFKFSARAVFGEGTFKLEAAETVESSARTFSKSQEYVLRYLREHGPSLIDDIESHAVECSANAARKAVYSLASPKIGVVKRVDSGGAGKVARYGLGSSEISARQLEL